MAAALRPGGTLLLTVPGITAAELDAGELDARDPRYDLVVTVRAFARRQ